MLVNGRPDVLLLPLQMHPTATGGSSADTRFIPKHLVIDRSSLKARYTFPRAGQILAKTAVPQSTRASFPFLS